MGDVLNLRRMHSFPVDASGDANVLDRFCTLAHLNIARLRLSNKIFVIKGANDTVVITAPDTFTLNAIRNAIEEDLENFPRGFSFPLSDARSAEWRKAANYFLRNNLLLADDRFTMDKDAITFDRKTDLVNFQAGVNSGRIDVRVAIEKGGPIPGTHMPAEVITFPGGRPDFQPDKKPPEAKPT